MTLTQIFFLHLTADFLNNLGFTHSFDEILVGKHHYRDATHHVGVEEPLSVLGRVLLNHQQEVCASNNCDCCSNRVEIYDLC